MSWLDQGRTADTAEVAEPESETPRQDFYGWHVEHGHSPRIYGADIECNCGEIYQPEPEAGG
jgi:hypothetical protein